MKNVTRELRKRRQGYSGARPDVVSMVVVPPARVLDIGCGAGVTAQLLKDKYPGASVVGLEVDPQLARLASERVDLLVEGSAESPAVIARLSEEGPFDLIICADVLEHLHDPWRTLAMLGGLLTAGGLIVTSIPNVRHVSTFVSLGVLGSWPRRDRGIHDRTHLRFFARKDMLALGASADLEMIKERRNLRLIEANPWTMVPARLLDFWPFRPFFTFQYLHAWKPRSR